MFQTCRPIRRSVEPGQVRLTALPPPTWTVPDRRKVRDHLVGDDHGDGDREQRLAEILSLVPAQQRLLDDNPDHGDDRGGDEHREHPLPGGDVGARDREAALSRHRCCTSYAM